jgi:hypothetical protein
MTMDLPLSDIRVIDLTIARAGPTCVRQLADWGADVIRVEPPGSRDSLGGDRHGSDFQQLHRNKRSLSLAAGLYLAIGVLEGPELTSPTPARRHETGTDKLLAEVAGPVATVTFNNPARHNALSAEMRDALPPLLAALNADGDVRVIVVTGAGDKAFASGADISEFGAQRAFTEKRPPAFTGR